MNKNWRLKAIHYSEAYQKGWERVFGKVKKKKNIKVVIGTKPKPNVKKTKLTQKL